MGYSVEDFNCEFRQDIYGSADADGRYVEDAFYEHFCSYLIDAGEVDTADRVQYLSSRGIRIDGYGGDPLSNDGVLSLIISDFNPDPEITTLTATQMNAIFKRADNFIAKTLDHEFRDRLEETSPAFGLADLIAARWPKIDKVRILLISNRILSDRVDGREAGEIGGTPITYSVWDLGRLYRFVSAGKGREDIEIDLQEEFGGGLPALPAHLDDAGYEAYLVVVPGKQLAAIYDRWGPRLLEQNVRVFLQGRGKVNKGIRITLENNPEMFFAYNNGITATAESVQTRQTRDGLIITGFRNLQIVNGGQTTASIHTASKNSENNLSRVFVQMKLSIVDPDTALEVVPKISEYANTQNRVNAADFFANHPFHTRMESFSRRVYAPSPDGTFRESKWFYERARGQYQDARAHLTTAQRKKFDLEYPKKQMFTKTDLAKFLMLWRGKPDVVSQGAQKNFAEFASIIGDEWLEQPDTFNELFYRETIAKAIIFKTTEKLVSNQSWYEGGYRANIVAYAIAKLAHDATEKELAVDFESIWRNQAISSAMHESLEIVSRVVHDNLVTPPPGAKNVTEWAKKQPCWKRIKEQKIKWPGQLFRELISIREQKNLQRSAKKDQRMLNNIESQAAVIKAGADFWREVKNWGTERSLLSPKEDGVLKVASNVPSKVPTEKQSIVILQTLKRLQDEGCQLNLNEHT